VARVERAWVASLTVHRVVRRRLLLASASPARRQLLAWAGFEVDVEVSGASEEGSGSLVAAEIAERLAVRKAEAVAARHPAAGDAPLVLGCDSLLALDGSVLGKPADAATARKWWRSRRGRSGHLWSGLCLIDGASRGSASGAERAVVRFGHPSDDEIDAYVASGEPLEVAGGFTMEGRGAPFLEGIDGHPSTVMGLSLPLLRRLVLEVTGRPITDLWTP